jgi:hypothetical protein
MELDTKASNIILVIFQMKVTFQQNVFFQHTCSFEWKTCPDVFCEITGIKLFISN